VSANLSAWVKAAGTRLVTGDGQRKSRFHTYSGEPIDWQGLRYLPHAVGTTLLAKVFSYRVRAPWMGFRAVAHIKSLIGPDSLVLEFGSGMSSEFFAQRCRKLVSIESDPEWYARMLRRFEERRFQNVDYRLLTEDDYTNIEGYPDHSFDFVLVDGARRTESARTALAKVKPGGHVYLDNSDVPYFQRARATLIEAAASDPGAVRVFRDLCPTQIAVSEGLLVRTRT
jgi:predicted O-methyltransferase YrrM